MTLIQRVVALVGVLSLGVLTACTVVEETGPRPQPSRPQMCTMEFDPVCARRGDSRQTFSNACQAQVEGYRIIGRGECRPERPDFGDDRPQVCTREYNPVCAAQGRRQQTFANGCMAEAEGFRVIGRGECRRPENRPVDDSDMRPPREPDRRPQACTREYAPVCARQGRQRQTFPNACTAEGQGFRVIDNNPCQ